ncbi:hypothetical protein OsJ_28660 [Oryza sativa Japonica Group]|uniref:Uncharacterized protein n=1 Tax=Oryza sativa subsp. japonica TaxID=39947 RepID=Q6H435_ORYSJ|nr:hypothetical protein OsJ_28660 [Oryza sativa Japonica Group]BAD26514.1 hypothetical protein [Oryza sativa Japonica Group]
MAQNVPSKGVKIPIDSSYWNDYNTRVVCDIFADQVATGLGLDDARKAVTTIAARWKQLKSDIAGCTKFMKVGLQNEELLEKMFEDIHNTDANH